MKRIQSDGRKPSDSPKSIRRRILICTAIVVCNGLFACFDIETEGYFPAAISVLIMLLYLSDLIDLWSRPCNSSR